jgi:hypothetical protein
VWEFTSREDILEEIQVLTRGAGFNSLHVEGMESRDRRWHLRKFIKDREAENEAITRASKGR